MGGRFGLKIFATKSIAEIVMFTALVLIAVSCGYKEDKAEEIEYKGSKLLYKHFTKTTVETTLNRHEIYFKSAASGDEKLMIGGGPEEMEIFPSDKSVLNGIDYAIIDTVSRSSDNSSPTMMPHTLYLDPEVFSKEDYLAIVEIVKDFYSRPIEDNKLVQWMDSDVLGLQQGDIYFTVYAIVHAKLSSFEPRFDSPNGKDWLKVRVNNQIYFHDTDKSGLETEGYWDCILRNDTLYFPGYLTKGKVDTLLTYVSKEGVPFRSRAKFIVPKGQ